MTSPDLALNSEFQSPVIGLEIGKEPNRFMRGALRMGLPFLALASFATACSNSGEAMDIPTGDSVPALATTTTTTELVPTTEETTTTQPTPSTEQETTTSVAPTETTEVQPNINNIALCEQHSNPDVLSPGAGFDLAGVPNRHKLKFFGGCTGLPGDLAYFWNYPTNDPGYVIDIDTTGFEYNARGEHFSELPVGRPDIPWDRRHPEFGVYGAITLRELAALERGDPICWYIGTKEGYSQDLAFGQFGLITSYNKYTKAEPETHVAIFFLNADGTEDPYAGWADGMGVIQDAKTASWAPSGIALGKCVDLPEAP